MLSALILMTFLAADPALTTIARGAMSAIEEAQEAIARTPAEWNALWKVHTGSGPAPAVNFATEMVVAVFLGTRPTGGFSVEIVGTRREASVLVVEYVEQAPGRGDIVTQVLTSPFHVVKLPRHAGAVRFDKKEWAH